MINAVFNPIKSLVLTGSRKRVHARARLRALAIVDSSLTGIHSQPGDPDLRRLVKQVQDGKNPLFLFLINNN